MVRTFALLGLAVVACSKPSIRFEALDEELQQARCEQLARCGMFPSEASCVTYFRVVANASLAGAIGADKVAYDGEQAKRCVEATAAQSCDLTAKDVRTPPIACIAMFTGRVAGGEMCSLDAECASGTCALPVECPEVECCIGTCRPTQTPSKIGGACAKNRDCIDSLVCVKDRTCQLPAKAGEDCDSDRECGAGLGCINPQATMPGTCRPLPHAGEPCPYLKCAEQNLRCDEVGTQTCVPLGLPGAACASGAECSPYMECNSSSHTCQELPTLGMACTAQCQGDAYCSTSGPQTGVCAIPAANGTPCESSAECTSSYCQPGPVFDSCNNPAVCF